MYEDKKKLNDDLKDFDVLESEPVIDTDQTIDFDDEIKGKKGGISQAGESVEEEAETLEDEEDIKLARDYDEDLSTLEE